MPEVLPRWVNDYKVKAVKNLPIFPLIHEWMISGLPLVEIARMVQDHGVWADKSLDLVQRDLGHYRATIPPAAILNKLQPQVVSHAKKQIKGALHYMEKFEQIMDDAFSHVVKNRAYMETLDVIGDDGLAKPMERYVIFLEKYVKLLKDSGLVPNESAQEPQSNAIDMDKVYGKPGMKTVFEDPRSRTKILGAVERLADLVQYKKSHGETLNIPIEETKSYEVVAEVDISTLQQDMTVEPTAEELSEPDDAEEVSP